MASTVNYYTIIFSSFFILLTFLISTEGTSRLNIRETNDDDFIGKSARRASKKRFKQYKPTDEEEILISKLSSGSFEFTKNLYDVLRKEPGNLIFSPLSLELALMLAYNGASGNTSEEIAKALWLPEAKEDSLRGANVLMKLSKKARSVELKIANGIFVHKDYKLKKQFITSSKKYLFAKTKKVNFGKSYEAARMINKFVDKNTNHKITELFAHDAFNDDTKLVLANAVYFLGTWEKPFNANDTYEGDFYLNQNKVTKVQFMTQKKPIRLDYKNDKELNAVFLRIPYSGHDVSMIIVVPNETDGLENVENKMKAEDLKKFAIRAQWSFQKRDIFLHLPKFKIEKTLNLESALKGMGMEDMFTLGKANFQELADDENLCVSKVVQKAYIEVNEEGTKAAAASGIEITSRMMPPPPVEVKIDRPFSFYLYHTSGNILFVGRVTNI